MKLKITVEFCMQCNYSSFASSFAEDVFEDMEYDVEEIRLVPGAGGVFEIYANGKKIFSKWETDRFPDHKEVINQLESMRNYGG